ncbi:MAG: DUF6603 domain-containing protein, partial [Bacteroidota bacterium]
LDKNLALRVALRVPSFLLLAELQQALAEASTPAESSEDGNKLVDQYLGSLKKSDGDFEIVNIRVLAAMRLQSYSLHLAVRNLLDAGPLHVAAFQADIDFAVGNTKAYAITAVADIRFELPHSALYLTVMAQRQSGADGNSWAFAGSVTQPVSFGELIQGISEPFVGDNIGYDLPDILEDIEIDYLQLAFAAGQHGTEKSKSFHFEIFLRLPISGKELDVSIKATYTQQTDGGKTSYQLELSGVVHIAGREFALVFQKATEASGGKSSILEVTYHGEDKIQLTELLRELSDEADLIDALPDIELDLKQDLMFALFKEQKSQNGTTPAKSTTKYLLGLSIGADLEFDFAALPIVGKVLSAGGDCGIKDFSFYLASQTLYAEEVARLPHPIPGASTASGSDGKTVFFTKGPNFRAQLQIGRYTRWIPEPPADVLPGAPLSASSAKRSGGQQSAAKRTETRKANSTSSLTQSRAQWLDIEQQVGPFTLERIGIAFVDKRFWFYLTSSLRLGPLTLGLDGLGIGAPLKDFSLDKISATLMGMSVYYRQGTLEVAGAFLHGDSAEVDGNKMDIYAGQLIVKAPPYGLMVLGMYGTSKAYDTFFVYGMLNAPLGGAAAFFVRGLAAGFGYNSKLNLPSIDKVQDYLLVKAALPPPPGGTNPMEGKDDPTAALQQLFADPPAVSPVDPRKQKMKALWLAAGLRFSSFELVQSFALLTVSIGNQLQLALLGRSQVAVPPKVPRPLAFAEISIKAVLTPEAKHPNPVFSLEAAIASGSYVLSQDCHLYGGLAFYLWANGDFVVSLGGYHPHFQKPDHYPAVRRAGISWRISSKLNIKGELYFAANPSTLMAGGRLEATFEAGNITANFTAHADFLVNWQPFHYDARISINVHVKVDLWLTDFNGHANVDLHLWGPDFSGTASINVGPASFSIDFGADKSSPPPLSWGEFGEAFLPKNNGKDASSESLSLLRISVAEGLLAEKEEGRQVVDPQHFELQAHCAVPATSATFHDKTVDGSWMKEVGVIPMERKGLQSELTIKLYRRNAKGDFIPYEEVDRVKPKPILGNGPKAMWSNAGTLSKHERLSAESSVKNLLFGVQISPVRLEVEPTLPPVSVAAMMLEMGGILPYKKLRDATSLGKNTRTATSKDVTDELTATRKSDDYKSLIKALAEDLSAEKKVVDTVLKTQSYTLVASPIIVD